MHLRLESTVENSQLKTEIESLKKQHIKEITAIREDNSTKQAPVKKINPNPPKPSFSDVLNEITSSEWNIT